MRHKRISLLLLSLLVITGSLIVATRYGRGQTSTPPKGPRMKLLRRNDQLRSKPTKEELARFQSEGQVNERKFEDKIPKHVPIKVKIKKEKEQRYKDLKNEKWAREFELEVTNTGEKPIYGLSLLLVTDVNAAAGYRIVAPVYYGRAELGDIRTMATPDDIPIKPGESCILKIHSGQLEAWEILKRKENRPEPKRVEVIFQGLSFGDGTGFAGTEGTALPRKYPNSRVYAVVSRKRTRAVPRVE